VNFVLRPVVTLPNALQSIAKEQEQVTVPSAQVRGRCEWIDIFFYVLIFGLGVFHFFSYMRVESFAPDSSYYIGLARSILERGKYEFNFAPHVFYPPAYPALLALISIPFGVSYFVSVRAAAIIGMLGLIASYELLCRKEGRGLAAAGCLILGFSGFYFYMSAQLVGSDVPYFLTSILFLLVVTGVDQAWGYRRPGIFMRSAITGLLVISLLMRTVGVALLAGMLAWLFIRALIDRNDALGRAKFFAPGFLVASLVLSGWMIWTQQVKVEIIDQIGEAGTYVDQFWLVQPHRPELGRATPVDLLKRVGNNLSVQASHASAIITRIPWIEPRLNSPLVFIPIVLVLLGWLSSVRVMGGELTEWYFAFYLGVCLLWPYDVGPRFIFPVFPLIFLYLYRGGMELARVKPWRFVFMFRSLLVISVVLAIYGVFTVVPRWAEMSLQTKASIFFWILTGGWMIFVAVGVTRVIQPSVQALITAISNPKGSKIAGGVAVAVVVIIGLISQVRGVIYNLDPKVSEYVHQPSKEAADWIANHAATTDVVMAQQVPIVHRVSGKLTVSFPVRSDPREIMAVIRRSRVNFLVAITAAKSTNLSPTESERSSNLEVGFPEEIKLVHQEPSYKIYQIHNASSVERPRIIQISDR
jgi:hypothetical protein